MAPKRTGNVRPRGNRWQARLQRPDGSTTSATFTTEGEAEAWITAETPPEMPSAPSASSALITFAIWVALWLDQLTHLRPSSKARAESAVRSQLIPEFGSLSLDAISTAMVRRWMARLIADGLAPATVTRLLRVLGSCLQVAAEDGLITANPARGIRPPAQERHEQMFLDPAEIEDLAGAMPAAYRGLVYLGAYGGLRIGEMLGLRVKHINPLKSSVRVVEQVVEVGGVHHVGPPKTNAGRRTVPLPRFVMEALSPHLEGKGPDDLVFPAAKGGYTRRTLWAARTWRPATKAAGLKGLGIHDLRHTAVALWVAAGASSLEITKRAGHTSSAFVLDRYGHLYEDGYEKTTNVLETMARGAAAGAIRGA